MHNAYSASARALPRRPKRSAPERHTTLPIWGFFAVVVLLALAGSYFAVGELRGANAGAASARLLFSHPVHGRYALQNRMPISVGALTVVNVQKMNGLTAAALAGSTHGVGSLVRPDQTQVETAIQLTNTTGDIQPYSLKQFRLIVEKTHKSLPVYSATVADGSLQPGASFDATLSFVAPRNGSNLLLQFRDKGTARPITVDLGRVGTTPKNAFDGYHHGHH